MSPAGPPPDGERLLGVAAAYDFDESLRFVPFGPYDPCCRRGPGQLWKAGHSPDGPVTLQLALTPDGVRARASGPGRRLGSRAGRRSRRHGAPQPAHHA